MRMNSKIFARPFLFLILGLPAVLLADTLHLRNGRQVTGTIVSQNRTHVTIRTAGRAQLIPKNTIRRIRYGNEAEELRRAAQKRAAEEKQREEARRKEEQRRQAEARQQEEQRKQAEEKRREEERKRAAAAKKETSESGKESSTKVADPSGGTTRVSVLWRSAVLPGWGQLHADDNLVGWGSMGAFFAGAVAAAYFRVSATAAKATYEDNAGGALPAVFVAAANGSSEFTSGQAAVFLLNIQSDDGNFSDYREQAARLKAAAVFTGVVYLAQLVHAAFFMDVGAGQSKVTAREWQLDLAVVPTRRHDTLQADAGFNASFAATWRF